MHSKKKPEIETCTAERHGTLNAARNFGCRCPAAIALAANWRKRTSRYAMQPAKVDAAGNCVAGKHGSRLAFLAGCRCPESIRKNDEAKAKNRSLAASYNAETMAILRVTGGRLSKDPRRRWRGPGMRVDRVVLDALLNGDRPRGTRGEMIVAVMMMGSRRRPQGPLRSRPIRGWEIAEWLGVEEREIDRRRSDLGKLRSERTARRLADSQWRAAVRAAAAERRAMAELSTMDLAAYVRGELVAA